MKQTTNYKLNKPDLADVVDIEVLNANMDTIDLELNKKSNTGHTHKKSEITDLPTSLPANGGNADTLGGKGRFEFLEKSFPLAQSVDFLTYVTGLSSDVFPSSGTIVIRAYDCTNMPYDSGDFICYVSSISPRDNRTYCTIVALDVRQNKTYRNTKNNGTWTGWKDLDNADTVDGKHASDFMSNANPSSSGAFTHGTRGAGAVGTGSTVFGTGCVASGTYSIALGEETVASGAYSHAEGGTSRATGDYAHAEGYEGIASGSRSHAEGDYTLATGYASHVEGSECTAAADYSHAEGYQVYAFATAIAGHAEGEDTSAVGYASHAEGHATQAIGDYSHAAGFDTASRNFAQTVIGKYCNTTTQGGTSSNQVGDVFVIGNGVGVNTSNAFRVTYTGVIYSKGSYNTSGADYAEYFEWEDGNINDEDRRGYFVTMSGDKIKIADSTSDFILGIVSGNPCIIGNSDEDWNSRWLKDEFGSYIIETYDEEETKKVIDEQTNRPIEIKTGNIIKSYRLKENPDYNPELEYIERKDRKEWSAIGMMGVLAVRDNGECKVNSYCTVGDDGVAIPSETGYRVIGRVTENIIKIILK